MEIIEMQVSEIIPYENNPRKNDSAVDAVAASIKEFGFKVPIIVDKENIIVAGHTRLKAAEQLGLETVPVIRADDLTEEQVRAFRLADNKTNELAGWDFSALDLELENIFDIDMGQFGFVDADITSFFDGDEDLSSNGDESEVSFMVSVVCKDENELDVLTDFLKQEGLEYKTK